MLIDYAEFKMQGTQLETLCTGIIALIREPTGLIAYISRLFNNPESGFEIKVRFHVGHIHDGH
jgi:hypothetical protein